MQCDDRPKATDGQVELKTTSCHVGSSSAAELSIPLPPHFRSSQDRIGFGLGQSAVPFKLEAESEADDTRGTLDVVNRYVQAGQNYAM